MFYAKYNCMYFLYCDARVSEQVALSLFNAEMYGSETVFFLVWSLGKEIREIFTKLEN